MTTHSSVLAWRIPGTSVAVVVKVGPAVRTEYRDLMLDQFWFFLAHLPSVSRRALLS